ncbi:MFS transporter [Candidatus Francisella endociliophora]|uniref:Lysosomal dipeptide transporter MFSD1 n=1 Tax=Candidatus Francisella endociliophora TaxID=653937 RepID=A0A097EQB8_9GAMM|nr:MFS transporter [Francisella sp. FSC1006]AIT09763.1 MFS transporter [Francisella sp. FSC1006]
MYKHRIKTLSIFIWFACAFFYALEYFIRSSSGALYDSFSFPPYNMTAAQISISSSAFYLCYVASQLPAGMLVDKYGVKRIMIASTLIFSIAIYIASVSTSPVGIIIYRALAGLGGGFAFLCAIKSIALWLPDRFFPLFTGMTQFFLYLGATLSAAPLVIINNYYSISAIMSGVFIVSLALFFISVFVIKLHPDFSKKQEAKKRKVSPFLILISVLKNKQIWLNGFYCFTIYGTTVLFADLWGIKYLQLLGFSADVAGTCTSLIFIGVAISSPLWGAIASLLNNEHKPLMVAPIIGFVVTIALLYLTTNIYAAFILCFLFGACQAVHVLNYSALRSSVSPARIATALALVNLFLPLSGGTLQPLTGGIIEFLSQNHSQLFAFQIALAIIPILKILSFIISLFIKDHGK